MALPMEFWGVEVKAGQPLKVSPGESKLLHLSQASLGESKNSKANDSVPLFVNINDQKLVIGTLSPEKFPQLGFDLVLEKEFELSHSWKHGSVFFTGYTTIVRGEEEDEDDLSDSDSDDEALPLSAVENGKGGSEASAKPSTGNANAAKGESSKPKVTIVEPMKVDGKDSDGDDEDDDDDDSDEEGSDDSEADSDEDDSEEEETPKKAEPSKKRPAESAQKTPVADKKAKVASAQKTDGKKGGHTATPHPAKQAGKTPANAKQQTPNSSKVSCQSCSKTFNSDNALQAHSKAKHGAK